MNYAALLEAQRPPTMRSGGGGIAAVVPRPEAAVSYEAARKALVENLSTCAFFQVEKVESGPEGIVVGAVGGAAAAEAAGADVPTWMGGAGRPARGTFVGRAVEVSPSFKDNGRVREHSRGGHGGSRHDDGCGSVVTFHKAGRARNVGLFVHGSITLADAPNGPDHPSSTPSVGDILVGRVGLSTHAKHAGKSVLNDWHGSAKPLFTLARIARWGTKHGADASRGLLSQTGADMAALQLRLLPAAASAASAASTALAPATTQDTSTAAAAADKYARQNERHARATMMAISNSLHDVWVVACVVIWGDRELLGRLAAHQNGWRHSDALATIRITLTPRAMAETLAHKLGESAILEDFFNTLNALAPPAARLPAPAPAQAPTPAPAPAPALAPAPAPALAPAHTTPIKTSAFGMYGASPLQATAGSSPPFKSLAKTPEYGLARTPEYGLARTPEYGDAPFVPSTPTGTPPPPRVFSPHTPTISATPTHAFSPHSPTTAPPPALELEPEAVVADVRQLLASAVTMSAPFAHALADAPAVDATTAAPKVATKKRKIVDISTADAAAKPAKAAPKERKAPAVSADVLADLRAEDAAEGEAAVLKPAKKPRTVAREELPDLTLTFSDGDGVVRTFQVVQGAYTSAKLFEAVKRGLKSEVESDEDMAPSTPTSAPPAPIVAPTSAPAAPVQAPAEVPAEAPAEVSVEVPTKPKSKPKSKPAEAPAAESEPVKLEPVKSAPAESAGSTESAEPVKKRKPKAKVEPEPEPAAAPAPAPVAVNPGQTVVVAAAVAPIVDPFTPPRVLVSASHAAEPLVVPVVAPSDDKPKKVRKHKRKTEEEED